MSGRKKAQAAVAATAKKRKGAARAEEDESQTIVDDAAADAQAEQAMVKETDQSATGASGSGASGGGSATRLPAGLLERSFADTIIPTGVHDNDILLDGEQPVDKIAAVEQAQARERRVLKTPSSGGAKTAAAPKHPHLAAM
jgi:hypothetical protein